MLLDYAGKIVKENDYLVEASEDTAEFYVVKDGKPQHIAFWNYKGNLKLIDMESYKKHLENLPEENENDTFCKNYLKKVFNRMINMDTCDMYLVSEKVKELLNQIQTNGVGEIRVDVDHICYL